MYRKAVHLNMIGRIEKPVVDCGKVSFGSYHTKEKLQTGMIPSTKVLI